MNHLDGLVAGFKTEIDRIIINNAAASYQTAEDAHAALIDTEDGAVLAGLDSSQILIQGVRVSDLTEDDFLIV